MRGAGISGIGRLGLLGLCLVGCATPPVQKAEDDVVAPTLIPGASVSNERAVGFPLVQGGQVWHVRVGDTVAGKPGRIEVSPYSLPLPPREAAWVEAAAACKLLGRTPVPGGVVAKTSDQGTWVFAEACR